MKLFTRIFFAALVFYSFTLNAQNYSNIEFVENRGQWDGRVAYMGQVPAGAFFIRDGGGFTALQYHTGDFERVYASMHGHGSDGQTVEGGASAKIILRSHSYNVDFAGANPNPKAIPDKPSEGYNNYFIGADSSKWASGCRIFQAVTLKDVYPGIDVRYYTESGSMKYDIIVHPGADPSRIVMKYTGADKLSLRNNELIISTSVGELKELSPYSYQLGEKGREDVNVKFKVKGDEVRFDVKGYDNTSTLVIDPVLVFCSFSGSTANNWGYTATYGPDGSMFGGGTVFAPGFPISPGAFQETFGGGTGGTNTATDIGIIRLSPNGQSRIYATYIGGSGNEQPHSLVVDGNGSLVMAGRSASGITYPVNGQGLYGAGGGWDIVVTKLSPDGTAMIGSKRIGGAGSDGVNIDDARDGSSSLERNYGDDGRSEVILDGAGNIYIASCTRSSPFYITPGAFQQNFGGQQDGVLIKLDANASNVLFSSYLGGTGDDAAYVLSLDPTGQIYVAGGTASNDFPGPKAGTVGAAPQGNIDGFVAVVSNDGSTLVRSTYIGTGAIDQVYGIQFDRNGFPYIMGQTTGTWQPQNVTFSMAGGKQFIGKLQPDLSAYVYTTMFGTNSPSPNISPTAFLVDRCENVYVSGWGGQISGNAYPSAGTSGLPVTPDAIKSVTDGHDFYFFVLARNGTSQLFGSFFGQNNGLTDHVDGGTSRFDDNGVIYQGICANCEAPPKQPYPTTPGVWAPANGSTNCNLAMVKIAFNLAGVGGSIRSSINGVPRDTAGCVPLTVDFTDTIQVAVLYEWHFGDGSPVEVTTSPNNSHTYNAVGTYEVMLVAIDSSTCNIRDTSYLTIRVGESEALPSFNFTKLGACDSYQYQFNNTTIPVPGIPFNDTSFVWDFGDGSGRVRAGAGPITHTFPAPGPYTVRLILVDTSYCNSPDSVQTIINVAALAEAAFTTDPDGCAPHEAVFVNNSVGGQSFEWDFGDGNTSTDFSPTHVYDVAGVYTIRLIVIDPGTCNVRDTAFATINVIDGPVSDFSFAPSPPVENAPIVFTNLSSANAVRFKWLFGDGDSLETTSRADVSHEYNTTGTFNACLIAFNQNGCSDTLCREVETLVVPAVDVPTGFTPNSNDGNNVVYVRGFGIAKMKFIIWNRWGQKVFETDNKNQGWNGRFKGELQPMDVYAYTLEVEFVDGTRVSKKGDITLIR